MTAMTLMQRIEAELDNEKHDKADAQPDCFGSIVFDATNTACIACIHKMACETTMNSTKVDQMSSIEEEIETVEAEIESEETAPAPVEPVNVAGGSNDFADKAASVFRKNRQEELTLVIGTLVNEKPLNCKDIRKRVQELLGDESLPTARFSKKLFAALQEHGVAEWDGSLSSDLRWLV